MKKYCLLFVFFILSFQSMHAILFEEKLVEVNDAQLYCRSYGTGEPLLVIHGGPGLSMDYLLPWLSKLAENRKVIFYDQRGCGKSNSKINEQVINIDTYLKDIESIKDAYQIKKMDILGHSWGGFLAMRYALKDPQSIQSLLLVSSMPANSEGINGFLEGFYTRMKPYDAEFQEIINSKEFKEGSPTISEKYYGLIFKTYLYDRSKIDLLNLKLGSKEFVDGIKINNMLTKIFFTPYNLLDSLKKLKVRALVIIGENDIVPVQNAQNIADALENSKFLLLKQCGHFPYIEQPYQFFDRIANFLNGNQ